MLRPQPTAPLPTEPQRRLLARLAAGATIRLPPWSTRIQVISASGETGYLPTPTFRVLLRYGWIDRANGAADRVPTYRLSEAGGQLLEPAPGP